MDEKLEILYYLRENGYLVTAGVSVEMIADSYTLEEVREMLQNFAEL